MAEREGFEPLRPNNRKASWSVLLCCYELLGTENKIDPVLTNSIPIGVAGKSVANILSRKPIAFRAYSQLRRKVMPLRITGHRVKPHSP